MAQVQLVSLQEKDVETIHQQNQKENKKKGASPFLIHIKTNKMKEWTEQILEKLEDFYATNTSEITEIIFKDGTVQRGFLEHFNDVDDLTKQGKCRFVPTRNFVNNSIEISRTGRLNPEHSIIIDLSEVRSVLKSEKRSKEIISEVHVYQIEKVIR